MHTLKNSEILSRLADAHAEQLALCSAIEEIANALPDQVDRQRCLSIARALGPILDRTHKLEEQELFPTLIERQAPGLANLAATLQRLQLEHYADECFAEELQDALMSLGRGDSRLTPDALGYMFRGFFENTRRHIALEQELVASLDSSRMN